MAIQDKIELTVEEFDRWAVLPENADRRLEYIGGKVIEVVSNNLSSEIAVLISAMITFHVISHKLGRVTGADGGYMVAGERYIPDVAFISIAKQPQSSLEAYNRNPPDLAVEVLSPSNDADEMSTKIVNYLPAGTVVWVINPVKKEVRVFVPNQKPRTVGIKGTLDGGDILPEFSIKVADIFPAQD